jgi:hypothetical protein
LSDRRRLTWPPRRGESGVARRKTAVRSSGRPREDGGGWMDVRRRQGPRPSSFGLSPLTVGGTRDTSQHSESLLLPRVSSRRLLLFVFDAGPPRPRTGAFPLAVGACSIMVEWFRKSEACKIPTGPNLACPLTNVRVILLNNCSVNFKPGEPYFAERPQNQPSPRKNAISLARHHSSGGAAAAPAVPPKTPRRRSSSSSNRSLPFAQRSSHPPKLPNELDCFAHVHGWKNY